MNYEIKDWPDREGYWWMSDWQGYCLVRSEFIYGELCVIEMADGSDWLRLSDYETFPPTRFAWLGEKFPEEDES